ncbi:radical SAM protein [candidate division KSB1 bacterium]|nr:radical SAM protein [candidate division KSB1 bacterium]
MSSLHFFNNPEKKAVRAVDEYRASLIEQNRIEYGADYDHIAFMSPSEAAELTAARQRLVDELGSYAQFGYKRTKVDVSRLSPGCRLCAEGTWSCLFISGLCNAHCLYCPSSQDQVGVPMTNTLQFPRPDDYAAYIEEFGFAGVSLSGGEPLLTLEKSVEFLKRIKTQFGDRVYFWIYTNGLLLTVDRALQLRDAGIDEIRFNIGATDYRLDFVRHAIGIIPTVTVEIPALPDKIELLKAKIGEMKDQGVDYLNLHQLRLTPYNCRHLLKLDYSFAHGENVTVPASEIAALKLLRYNFEHEIGLPINYCSFVYKNRFQRAGARKRAATAICKPWEQVTENGYIRTIEFVADVAALDSSITKLSGHNIRTGWKYDAAAQRLWLTADMLDLLNDEQATIVLSYSEASLRQNLSFRHPYAERTLAGHSVYIERWIVAKDIALAWRDWQLLRSGGMAHERVQGDRELLTVYRHEYIAAGLADYY